MAENLPSIETLRLLLRYEPETGRLFWRERPVGMFADCGRGAANHAKTWNSRYAGAEAFTACTGEAYRCGAIFGRSYLAHRVIWAIVHGKWPKDQIDHINGDRTDNRIENLRAVTNAENGRNVGRARNNTSGTTGVCWANGAGKWMAYIKVYRRNKHLGYFNTLLEAAEARKTAEIQYGYHENHGRVAA